MDLNLKDKVVAVAGGTSGIGEAVAMAFAKEGCKVAVCGRSQSKIDAMQAAFQKEGFELLTMSVDVGVNAQLKSFTEAVVETYGRLDIFINNAGISIRKPFETLSEEDWYKVINTNQKSVFFGCAFAAEQMRKTGGGVIINTSSFTSVVPTCGSAVYSSTKAAVDKMTKVFAAELAADHIRVVGVQPGMTVSPLTEEECRKNFDRFVSLIAMKRLAYPEDMVGAYLFLASDMASYISGVSLPVAGAKLTAQNPHYSWQLKETQK